MPFATAAFPIDPAASIERIAEHTQHTAVFRLEQDGTS
jgi:hypothetical protein